MNDSINFSRTKKGAGACCEQRQIAAGNWLALSNSLETKKATE
jgi:hypothetical protein